jgi:hypothetical protein
MFSEAAGVENFSRCLLENNKKKALRPGRRRRRGMTVAQGKDR